MSIRVMTEVWEHSAAEGNTLLVQLALADNADNKSGLAWPSVGDLARRTRVDERTVQRHLRKLEELGEVEVVRKGGRIDGEYRATVYRVRGQGRQPATAEGRQVDTPGAGSGVTAEAVRGDKSGHSAVTALSPQPSVEPSTEPSKKDLVLEDLAQKAFDHWHQTFSLNGQTRFTDRRRSKVLARLRSTKLAPTPAERAQKLNAAIDFVGSSSWHRQNGHIDLELIARSDDQVEAYLLRAATTAAKTDNSAYDRPAN